MLKYFEMDRTTISVQPEDSNWVTVSLVWLRDHCQCTECYHPDTKQRLVNTSSFPEELEIAEGRISDDGSTLTIVWEHTSHISKYNADLFETLRYDPENLDINYTLWTARSWTSQVHPSVDFYKVMNDDKALLEFLELVEQYGFSFVENTPPTSHSTIELSERISYIRQTIFGGYYEMTANLEHKDTAYTSLAIGPHTDGTYSNDAPSYQVLHCLEEKCEGAMNILIDGFKIAEVMKNKYNNEFHILTAVQVPGQYIDLSKGIHLMARRPVFRLNDCDKLVQVSYNNHDRAPFMLNEPEDFYRALNTFARLCNDPDFHYRRKLLPGSVLFFDNWRVLHAREAYTGYRKLAGTYFNKEDVESKLRVLRAKYK